MSKIYVASSWRNEQQNLVVTYLREHGHEVYDFKNPKDGDKGFHWSEIDPDWENWNVAQYCEALRHPVAQSGFNSDYDAMQWADTCVLVLPSGRSAHIEAGYFDGAGKKLIILLYGKLVPELMYKMADYICDDLDQVVTVLSASP